MDSIKRELNGATADKILDVGTETGSFLLRITEILQDFKEAIGIDISDNNFEEARKKVEGQAITFIKADASKMPFSDMEFDLVLMNSVLHHVQDISSVLIESVRVLTVGGRLILREPYCDNQNEQQQVGIASHHWIAKVDRIQGSSHYSTLKRQQIIDIVKHCKLSKMKTADYVCGCDWKTNGMLEEEVKEVREYLLKLGDESKYANLRKEGEDIIRSLIEKGSSCATHLEVVGIK